jgi:large subunit ribosomal protein L7/L12
VTNEELVETIENMSVLELAELVKTLEDKFGVSASAPVAVAAGGVAAAQAEEEEEEEQVVFDVMLTEVGDQKIQVIKAVRELTPLGLREAKAVVDEAPSAILEQVSRDEADAAKERLEESGATIELQ